MGIHAQSRRSGGSASSSADRTPAAPRRVLLSLQQTAGNRAVAGMVQRDASYLKKDKKAMAEVRDGGSPITVTGTNVDKVTGESGPLTGGLTYSETRVPGKAVGDDSFLSKIRDPATLEINVMEVKPQGTGLGNVLMWHLARIAQGKKIDYIVAGHVSKAREPFYEPLGFLDYRNAPTWASLVAEKTRLEQQMAGPSPPPDIADKYNAVVEAMDENKIFAPTAALVEAARGKWSERWNSG